MNELNEFQESIREPIESLEYVIFRLGKYSIVGCSRMDDEGRFIPKIKLTFD